MSCNPVKLVGLGACPGICLGRAVVFGGDQAAPAEPEESAEPVVLVGYCFSPEEVLSMESSQVCGCVMQAGGVTASAGLVARLSGLVAVLGCEHCDSIQTGDLLLVDGYNGEVLLNPSADVIKQYEERLLQEQKREDSLKRHCYLPAETRDGLKVDVLAQADLVDTIPQAITGGAGGIGLLRSEFYYLTDDGLPSEEFLFTLYQHVLSSVAPLPVTIRILDLSGGSSVSGVSSAVEQNPALGLKGVRFSLCHPQIFKTQLRALYRASAFGRLRILLPMVGSFDELITVKKIIAEVEQELVQADVAVAEDVELGLVIEVPASVFIAGSLASEVDFFAIGLNDLIQYGFAIDRGNEQVAHLYEPLHPALLGMIDRVIVAGHQAGIHVGVCGEMAGDSLYTPLFLGLGVDWLSMPPTAIPAVKNMVRKVLADDCCALAEHLLRQSSATVSRVYLQEFMAKQDLN